LAALSKKTFKEAFESKNNPDDFKAYLNAAFSEDTLIKELQDYNSSFFLVYRDSNLAGYFKLNQNGSQSDIRDNSALEIERIYVLEEFQGQGIGAWMLEQVISMATEKNKDYVWLGVWERNTKAIAFYERLGFHKFGSHPYYIGKDEQTDWLMRLDMLGRVNT
jgi:ribosomal protein S18 acetylase RimI-like enzyme